MRIAIISDTHGNCVALDSVLADLQQHPVDTMVCLGDAIQGGPQPAELVARLRNLACPVVMGNADAFLLSGEEDGNEEITPERMQRLRKAREWSLSRLSADDRAFLSAFLPTVTLRLGAAGSLLCFHGSPISFDDFILPDTPAEEFNRLLGPYAEHFLTGGHMHVQYIRHMGKTFFFNPGSVGVAYRHGQSAADFRLDPWAEYAVLTVAGERLAVEFRRVPFDTEVLLQAYHENGHPFPDEAALRYSPR